MFRLKKEGAVAIQTNRGYKKIFLTQHVEQPYLFLDSKKAFQVSPSGKVQKLL